MAVTRELEAVSLCDRLLQLFDPVFFELFDASALHADEVVVMTFVVRELVACRPVAKLALVRKAAFRQELQRSIHRRVSHRRILFADHREKIVDAEVSLRFEKDVAHKATLIGGTQALLTDVIRKLVVHAVHFVACCGLMHRARPPLTESVQYATIGLVSADDDDLPKVSRSEKLLKLAILVILPASLAIVMFAVMMGGSAQIDLELQLFVQREVKPGTHVAIRGLLLSHLHGPDVPQLESAPAEVVLRTNSGDVLARTRLLPTEARSLEGHLDVPASLAGRFFLEGRSVLNGETARTFASLDIKDAPRPLPTRGRSAYFGQQESLGEMRAEAGQTPPNVFEPRVLGGACVPAIRCDVLVRVGSPAASADFLPSASIQPLPGNAQDLAETTGVVPLAIQLRGPEGESDVRALRGGVAVGARRFQVPVALGEPVLAVNDSVFEAPATPQLRIQGIEMSRAVIVDAFRDGMWERTGVVSEAAATQGNVAIPFAPLTEGTWRIQIRTDPFSADSAGTRVVHVVAHGTPRDRALRNAIALEVRPYEVPADMDSRQLARLAAFTLSAFERERMTLPTAWSGQHASEEDLQKARTRVRILAVVALGIIALVLALIVALRGMRSAVQARELMKAAGDERADDPKLRRRQTLTLVLMVALIVLFFLAAMTFVIARTSF